MNEQIAHLGRCLSEAAKSEKLVKREEEVLLARKREEELQFEKKKLEQILKLNPSGPATAKPAKESETSQISNYEMQWQIRDMVILLAQISSGNRFDRLASSDKVFPS